MRSDVLEGGAGVGGRPSRSRTSSTIASRCEDGETEFVSLARLGSRSISGGRRARVLCYDSILPADY